MALTRVAFRIDELLSTRHMTDFCFVIPTRKRLPALTECLCSIVRAYPHSRVYIQDNSADDPCDLDYSLSYFAKRLDLRIECCNTVVPMCANWDRGVGRALADGNDLIAVLPDRRVCTKNIHNAIAAINYLGSDYLAFDHQSVWFGSGNALHVPRSFSSNVRKTDGPLLLDVMLRGSSMQIMPMLLNTLVTSRLFDRLRNTYGSYVSGSNPDFNFMARIACESVTGYSIDTPVFATNANYAASSNGNNFSKLSLAEKSLSDYASNLQYYPSSLPGFITTSVLAEFIDIGMKDALRTGLVVRSVIERCLLELSFPLSVPVFTEQKDSLDRYVRANVTQPAERDMFINHIVGLKPNEAEQRHPISASTPLTPANLNLLSAIE